MNFFCLKICNFSVINLSVYLNRHVFVMLRTHNIGTKVEDKDPEELVKTATPTPTIHRVLLTPDWLKLSSCVKLLNEKILKYFLIFPRIQGLTVCMKCQILFSVKNKKNVFSLSSAELAQRMVTVELSGFDFVCYCCGVSFVQSCLVSCSCVYFRPNLEQRTECVSTDGWFKECRGSY